MSSDGYKKAPGKPPRIIVALGGNALGDTPQEQQERIKNAASALLGLIVLGNEIVVTHGNGPQVGMIQKAFATANDVNPSTPAMDLPECNAMSQGYIGYHLQKGLANQIRKDGRPWWVATVVTEIEVDPDDPAFENPSKPIGQFLTKEQAEAQKAENPEWTFIEDSGRGWRRVVASPSPKGIIEIYAIRNLLDNGYIVVACGGGGIPVVFEGPVRHGVGAVIDKDAAGELLAEECDAETLILLTAVDHVAINFGKPNQEDLTDLTVEEAERYLAEGQFGKGSMEPKVQAAVKFAKSEPGRVAIIGSLEKAADCVLGKSGTRIHV